MQQRAFTLVELLVVVAIIALLAGLLMPSLSVVRSSARATACAGNLRQLGMAFQGYANDQEDCLPAMNLGKPAVAQMVLGGFYPNLLQGVGVVEIDSWAAQPWGDVRSGVWRCPAVARTAMGNGGGYGVLESTHGLWYAADRPSLRRSQVSRISTRALLADSEDFTSGAGRSWYALWCPRDPVGRWDLDGTHRAAARHGGDRKVGVAFMDGHVAATAYVDLKANADDIWRHDAP